MALEVVVVKSPPSGHDFWQAMTHVVPRAMAQTVIKARTRAPRGRTGKLSTSVGLRIREIQQGLIFGVQAEIGTRAPYGHLVARGHRIVARGPQRKGRRLTRVQRGALRTGLKNRRAAAIGVVPPNPFAQQAISEDRSQIVRLIEKLLQLELVRAV